MSTVRLNTPKFGEKYPVRDSYHYPLPHGLKEGDLVKVIGFDHGYWRVEKDGQQYSVFLTQVYAGQELITRIPSKARFAAHSPA